MTAHVPAVRRLCLVVDIEGYSRHPGIVQFELQRRLWDVLRAAAGGAGIVRRRTHRQDRGDGQLIFLPPGVDEARALPGFIRGMLRALEDDRLGRGDAPALRLRLATGQGVVQPAATGFVGKVVVDVCRLADAGEVRAELVAVPDADLCLVVTDDLYRDVVVQGYGGLPGDGFRTVHVRDAAKGFDAVAWMRALTAAALADIDPVAATALATLPFVVAGSVLTQRTLGSLWSDDPGPLEPEPDPDPTYDGQHHPHDPAHDDLAHVGPDHPDLFHHADVDHDPPAHHEALVPEEWG